MLQFLCNSSPDANMLYVSKKKHKNYLPRYVYIYDVHISESGYYDATPMYMVSYTVTQMIRASKHKIYNRMDR